LWDSLVASRGSQTVDEHGHLAGPFSAFIYAPDAGRHLDPLGALMRFGTSVDRRLAEVAIMTVAAHWKAEFEWTAHSRVAREQGVADAIIEAIGSGEDPPFAAADERTVYEVARQLMQTGQVSQDLYDAAQQLLGDTGLVELVSMCGYYTVVSFILNAFGVPLRPGSEPYWGERR